jgi:acetoin utilization deacetylase AcuC-like enzyme
MDTYFDPIFLKHDTGLHPESADRFSLLLESLDKSHIKKPQNGEGFLELAHTPEYVEQVELTSKVGGKLDPDTPVSAKTYEAACYAVGAAVDASENSGFALVRPPGHHAFSDRGSGFCVFNNMAVAALRLAEKGKKVFILDIDIHHGNGTEEIVLNQKNTKFLSIHEYPSYPGTGQENRGENVVNVPLPPETNDEDYVKTLEEKVVPEIEVYEPDIIGVSVGFDTYYLDNAQVVGSDFLLTTKTYHKIKEILGQYEKFFVMEGGYSPQGIMEGAHALMDL